MVLIIGLDNLGKELRLEVQSPIVLSWGRGQMSSPIPCVLDGFTRSSTFVALSKLHSARTTLEGDFALGPPEHFQVLHT